MEEKLVAHEGLVLEVGRWLGLFYTKNVIVVSWYPEWLQGAPNILIVLFWWYGMVANVAKSKAMTCQPG